MTTALDLPQDLSQNVSGSRKQAKIVKLERACHASALTVMNSKLPLPVADTSKDVL